MNRAHGEYVLALPPRGSGAKGRDAFASDNCCYWSRCERDDPLVRGPFFSLTPEYQLLSQPGTSEFPGVQVYFESLFNIPLAFIIKIIENKIYFKKFDTKLLKTGEIIGEGRLRSGSKKGLKNNVLIN